jgi:hypothetical protein
MITLCEIDAMFPGEFRGSVYSDLHKDAFGFRPRGSACEFESIEDFDRAWDYAQEALESEMARETQAAVEAKKAFEKRVYDVMEIMPRSTRRDVIRLLLDAQGITKEDIRHYGYEYADYDFGLKYGTIAKMMEAA